jgi:alanine racemase
MSHLDNDEKASHPLNERQISLFRDLCRVYRGIPGSLANSSGIFLGQKAHFDLVRAGSALYGVNPTPSRSNPMPGQPGPGRHLHLSDRRVRSRRMVGG